MRQRKPRHIDGKAGYYCLSMETCITAGTWDAALRFRRDRARRRKRSSPTVHARAFALCRPPGHHAHRDMYGGYCFLNNAAIARAGLPRCGRGARRHPRCRLPSRQRHAGHFLLRATMCCSARCTAQPEDAYPYFLGFKDEKGEGKGEGFNINYPMPPLTAYDVVGQGACRRLPQDQALCARRARRLARRRYLQGRSDQLLQARFAGLQDLWRAHRQIEAVRPCSSWKAAMPSKRSASTR